MPEVVGRYDYVAEDETLLFQVERLKPKGFRQRRSDGNGGWIYNLNGTRRVLYRLPKVIEAVRAGKRVVVVEGEKDVHALEAKGAVATTSPGGAGKWLPEFNEVLCGARVMIISDADDPGRRHALSVACELDRVVADLRIYEPASPHKDISDHLKAGLTSKQLVPFDRSAVQAALGERNGNRRRRVGVISAPDFCKRPGLNGSLRVLGPLAWKTMRVSLLGSKVSGDGKTTLGCQMLRAIAHEEEFLGWKGCGGRVLIVDVEQGEETVKQRLRDLNLDDDPLVDLLWEPEGLALDSSPEDRKYVEDVLTKGNYKAALFDPLYQLHRGDQNSERVAADVMRTLDDWARTYEFCPIIPTHPRKPHPQAGLNSFSMADAAGSGAWVRNAEIVLGLQYVGHGFSKLHFFKDRPGYGPAVGTHWNLTFDTETHTFSRGADDDDPTWKKLHPLLSDNPGMTLAELTLALGVTKETVRRALIKIGAHENKAGGSSRWALEPWPDAQPSLLSVVGDGATDG